MLIDDDVLLDAGTGVGDLPLESLRKIRHVLLTHAHLDHIAGLPFLIDSIFDARIGDPLVIYGRAETLETIQKHIFNWEIWPDFAQLPDVHQPVLRYETLGPGQAVNIDNRLFHAIDVRHTVPAQGYCISHSDGVFAVSGDTTTNATLSRTGTSFRPSGTSLKRVTNDTSRLLNSNLDRRERIKE
ncbi:MAG: 3',5'-cyclic-nucleotide phosphodiesterase, partial [Pseudomonadota bacterium]